MSIDWLTVGAQIINFLVLVWLLQRFLYQPVIEAMDQREQRIADRLNTAQQREQTAAETVAEYEDKRTALEQSGAEYLAQAKATAQQEQQAMTAQARTAVQQQREVWQQQLQQEQQDYLKGLRKTSVAAIQQTGHKVLQELADTTLETQIIDVFLKRLEHLDDNKLADLKQSADSLLIRSAFVLDEATKTRITQALHQHLSASARVDYALSEDLVCGISLEAGGYQVGWNMAEHLHHLDEQLQQLINQEPESNV